MSTYTRDWGEAITFLWNAIENDKPASITVLIDAQDIGNCAYDSYESDLSHSDVEDMYYALLEIKKGIGLLK